MVGATGEVATHEPSYVVDRVLDRALDDDHRRAIGEDVTARSFRLTVVATVVDRAAPLCAPFRPEGGRARSSARASLGPGRLLHVGRAGRLLVALPATGRTGRRLDGNGLERRQVRQRGHLLTRERELRRRALALDVDEHDLAGADVAVQHLLRQDVLHLA